MTWESWNNRDDIKRTSIRIFTKDFAIFVALAYALRLMYLLTTRKELTSRLDRWKFLPRNLPEILQLLSRKHTYLFQKFLLRNSLTRHTTDIMRHDGQTEIMC